MEHGGFVLVASSAGEDKSLSAPLAKSQVEEWSGLGRLG